MAIETVLVALGPSDESRVEAISETVRDIAGPSGATVVLAHVFTPEEYEEAIGRLDFADPDDATAEDVAQRLSIIRDVEQSLSDADIDYRITGGIGDHGPQIVEIAEEEAADHVIVGGRRRSPTGKAVFGSTSQHVLLESPAPVTFVRGED